jgi:hypothetical protein
VVYPWKVPPPPVANQINLFMHFLGASRDGLVARPVEMNKLSSSDRCGSKSDQFISTSGLGGGSHKLE